MAAHTSSENLSNPNILYRDCLTNAAKAVRCGELSMSHRLQSRRAMFRVAAAYQKLVKYHQSWLLDQAKAAGGIDRLLDSWFAPLAFFGEDYHELLRDVSNGVTEKAYLNSSAGSFTRKKRVLALVKTEHLSIIDLPDLESFSSPEEAADAARQQNRLLRSQVKKLNSENAELKRISARQERRIEELETSLNRIEKTALRVIKTA